MFAAPGLGGASYIGGIDWEQHFAALPAHHHAFRTPAPAVSRPVAHRHPCRVPRCGCAGACGEQLLTQHRQPARARPAADLGLPGIPARVQPDSLAAGARCGRRHLRGGWPCVHTHPAHSQHHPAPRTTTHRAAGTASADGGFCGHPAPAGNATPSAPLRKSCTLILLTKSTSSAHWTGVCSYLF